jgi:hypothetical protein
VQSQFFADFFIEFPVAFSNQGSAAFGNSFVRTVRLSEKQQKKRGRAFKVEALEKQ